METNLPQTGEVWSKVLTPKRFPGGKGQPEKPRDGRHLLRRSNGTLLRSVREWRREPVLSEAEGWAPTPPTITWAQLARF
jgi:hypothetical protein